MTLRRPSPRGWAIAAVGTVLAVGVPLAIGVGPHHAWEAVPGFYFWFGAAGCAAIVAVAKTLGARCVQRPEDFHD